MKFIPFITGILVAALTHPFVASASPASGYDVKAEILNTIPMTTPSPWQHFEGVSQNGNKCQISISDEKYPQRYLSISGIEYVPPFYQGDYHYFQISESEVANNLSDRSRLVFSIGHNPTVQTIEIVSNSNQRLVSISDKKGTVQCRIDLN